MLLYEITDDQSHNRGWDKYIEEKIKSAIRSYHTDGISWYFGAVKENNIKYLQLVIAEENIYDSRSVKLINYVQDQLGHGYYTVSYTVIFNLIYLLLYYIYFRKVYSNESIRSSVVRIGFSSRRFGSYCHAGYYRCIFSCLAYILLSA